MLVRNGEGPSSVRHMSVPASFPSRPPLWETPRPRVSIKTYGMPCIPPECVVGAHRQVLLHANFIDVSPALENLFLQERKQPRRRSGQDRSADAPVVDGEETNSPPRSANAGDMRATPRVRAW